MTSNAKHLVLMTTKEQDKINEHLRKYTNTYGKHKRLNEQDLPFDACSINLSLINNCNNNDNNSSESVERKQVIKLQKVKVLHRHRNPPSQNNLSNTSSSPSQSSNRRDKNTSKSVKCFGFQDLLKFPISDKSSSSSGSGRVFILGGPNMGKTVLCKKLMHEFYNNNNEYMSRLEKGYKSIDHIIWIELRRLSSYFKDNESSFVGICPMGFFEKFACSEYFSGANNEEEGKRLARVLIEAVNANEPNIMYILDGLDEIINDLENDNEGRPNLIGKLIHELLAKPRVICTSRPYAINLLTLNTSFSYHCELVGLSLDNVTTYINKIIPESSREIKGFIKQYNFIAGLIVIPGYLDLLCICWKEIKEDIKNQNKGKEFVLNMTTLHQVMITHLLREYAKNKNPKEVQKLTRTKILKLSEKNLEELFNPLLSALEELAFSSFQNNQILFKIDNLHDNLELSPFLISNDITKSLHKRNYEFNSYLIQEYFTSRYIAKNITTLNNFILKNKYNPKYEVVWWFVAGILACKNSSAELTCLFNLFQQPPRDLFHVYHYNVLICGCLYESVDVLDEKLRSRLCISLRDWLCHKIQIKTDYKSSKPLFIAYLPDQISEQLVDKLKDEDDLVVRAASRSLRSQTSLGPKTINALMQLFTTLTLTINPYSTFRIKLISRILSKQVCLLPPEHQLTSLLYSIDDPKIKYYIIKVLKNQTNLSLETINLLLTLIFNSKFSEDDLIIPAIDLLQDQINLDAKVKEMLVNHFIVYNNKFTPFSEYQRQILTYARALSKLLSSTNSLSQRLVDGLIQLLEEECEDRAMKYNSTTAADMIAWVKMVILRELSKIEDLEFKIESILLNELFSYECIDGSFRLKHQMCLNAVVSGLSERRQRLSQQGRNLVKLEGCSWKNACYYNVLYSFVVAILNPASNPEELYYDDDDEKGLTMLSYYDVDQRPNEAKEIYQQCLGSPAQDILSIILEEFKLNFDCLNGKRNELIDKYWADMVTVLLDSFKNEDLELEFTPHTLESELELNVDDSDIMMMDELKNIESEQSSSGSSTSTNAKNHLENQILSLLNKIKGLINEIKNQYDLARNVQHASDILSCQIKPDNNANSLIMELINCTINSQPETKSFITGEVLNVLNGVEQYNTTIELFQIQLLFDINISNQIRSDIILYLNKLDKLSDAGEIQLEQLLLVNEIPDKLLSTYIKLGFNLPEGAGLINMNVVDCFSKTQGNVTNKILKYLSSESMRDSTKECSSSSSRILIQLDVEEEDSSLENEDVKPKSCKSCEKQDRIRSELNSLISQVIDKELKFSKRKKSVEKLTNLKSGLSNEELHQLLCGCCGSAEGIELILRLLDNENNLNQLNVTQLINILYQNEYKDIDEELNDVDKLDKKLKWIYNKDNKVLNYCGRNFLCERHFTSKDLLNFISCIDQEDSKDIVIKILKYQNFNEIINAVVGNHDRITIDKIQILYESVLAPMSFINHNISSVIIPKPSLSQNDVFIKGIKLAQKMLNFPSDTLVDDLSRVLLFKDIDEIRYELKSINSSQASETSSDPRGNIFKKNYLLQLTKIKVSNTLDQNLEEIIIKALKPKSNNEPNFIHLDLSNNSFVTKHMKQLCKALESPLATHLKSLILSYNLFTYKDLKYLLRFLIEKESLKIQFLLIDHNVIYTSQIEFDELVNGFRLFGGNLLYKPLFGKNFEFIDISMNFLEPGKELLDATTSTGRKYYAVDYIKSSTCIHSKYEKAIKTLNGESDGKNINTLLSKENGAVSLFVRRRTLGFSGHTSIIIERIQPIFPTQRELIKVDLVYVNNRVKVRIANISPEKLTELRKESYWVRTGWIANNDIQSLLNNLNKDIATTEFMNYSTLNLFNILGYYNCYSFAVKRLKNVGIEIDWTYHTKILSPAEFLFLFILIVFCCIYLLFIKLV